MKTLHLLLVGRSRDLHRVVRSKNIYTTLLIEESKTKNDFNNDFYGNVIRLPDKSTPEQWAEIAEEIHANFPITHIGAFTETKEEHASEISKRLKLKYHHPCTVKVTHEKQLLRVLLKKHGLDDTKFVRLPNRSSETDVASAIESIGLPVIMKPANARGSLAIKKIFSLSELHSAYTDFQTDAKQYDILIEEMLYGPEYSVEAFSENGIHKVMTITQKFKDDETSIETGHLIPAMIGKTEEREIRNFIEKVLTLTGIKDGPSHTEIFLTKKGPRIVETHTRLGGDRIPDLIKLITGVDLDHLWVDQVLGSQVLDQVPQLFGNEHKGKWASVQYGMVHVSGTIQQIVRNSDQFDQLSIVESNALLKLGDQVTAKATDSFSRATESIAIHDLPAIAIAQAKLGLNLISYNLIP